MSFLRLLILPVFCACCWGLLLPQSANAEDHPAIVSQESASTINAQDLQHLLKKKKAVLLLDVRQPEEYETGHIQGAKLMPLDAIPDHFNELSKSKMIVVYCKSGRRSAQAMSLLQAKGFSNVVSLSGGFQAWSSFQDTKKEMRVCALSTGCQNR